MLSSIWMPVVLYSLTSSKSLSSILAKLLERLANPKMCFITIIHNHIIDWLTGDKQQDYNNNKDKKKKIVLVTGANRGIGFEACKQLAQLSNTTVILTARNFEKGRSATKQLKDKEMDVMFYQLDVSNNNDIKNIASQIEQQYGRLDVLVNNAAILYDTW